MAIDSYLQDMDEAWEEQQFLWKEAMEDNLHLKDPKLFMRMFSIRSYLGLFDNEQELKKALQNVRRFNGNEAAQRELKRLQDDHRLTEKPLELPF